MFYDEAFYIKRNVRKLKEGEKQFQCTHEQEVISTFAATARESLHFLFSTVQRKMATGQDRDLFILEFNSASSVVTVQREFGWRCDKTSPTTNAILGWFCL